MDLKIYHYTKYHYSEKVFLEPHHLYFYPCQRDYLKIKDFNLKVSPDYTGLAGRLDAENNIYHQCWFNEPLDILEIEMSLEVETKAINPFNYLIEEKPPNNKALRLYLDNPLISSEIIEWIKEMRRETKNDIVAFLIKMCRQINESWGHTIRYEEDIHAPKECFTLREGSCRDLTWMMINMLRSIDIPARFVSGYAYNDELGDGHELHSWVEAWVNGPGWMSFDPSAGLVTTENYVPVVTSYNPENTLPVQGTFRGTASSNIEFRVSIEKK